MTPTEDLSSLVEPDVETVPMMSGSAPVLTRKNLGGLQVGPVNEKITGINMLIYGQSGVGKTRLAGSASDIPEMSPVVCVDIEGGTFSLRDLYPNVDVVRCTNFKELQGVYDELYLGNTGYKTVIIDSLTEMQKFSMAGIMEDLVKKEPDRDPDIPSVREWGKNIEQIRRMVRAFRDLREQGINSIFTALVIEERNTRTGLTEKRPYLSGRLSHEVAGFIDIVAYYYTKFHQGDMLRLLLTAKTEDTVAKDRSARLPMLIGEEGPPVMKDLYDYILGEKSAAQG